MGPLTDLTDVVSVTRGLVDIDSTTGREGECMEWMAALLGDAGYGVVEQVVDGPRRNIYAGFGKADVVLSTHLDCVPPVLSQSSRRWCALRPRLVRRQRDCRLPDCGRRNAAA
jgi:acetylornithine deacetylase/succinyl-diaminopimelate desuccinylase-like protein